MSGLNIRDLNRLVWWSLSVYHWPGFSGDFVRLIWLVARLNLNGRCFGRCFINWTTFCLILQTIPCKFCPCLPRKKDNTERLCTLTCDNQFFVNFELNWWEDGHRGWLVRPDSGPTFTLMVYNTALIWVQKSIQISTPFHSLWFQGTLSGVLTVWLGGFNSLSDEESDRSNILHKQSFVLPQDEAVGTGVSGL